MTTFSNLQPTAAEHFARALAHADATAEALRKSSECSCSEPTEHNYSEWFANEVAERQLEAAAEEMVFERLLESARDLDR